MDHEILNVIGRYGYFILPFLMILEGPIITLAATFLASMGVLNVWAVLVLSIVSDICGDVGFYYLGRFMSRAYVMKYGKYIGITNTRVEKMKVFFKKHGGKTVFFAKVTTGFCFVTFFVAGMIKMNFARFLKFSCFGGVLWSGALVIAGYFFGHMYVRIAQYVQHAGEIIFVCMVLFFIVIAIFKKRQTKRIFVTKNV